MSEQNSLLRQFIGYSHAPEWCLWGVINVTIAVYFGTGLLVPVSGIQTAWLPGETTHGHHQIEMSCNACHDSATATEPSASDVMQDACIRCHGEQLKLARDTHPAKKFRDPTNAVLLEALDAKNCLTCHQEHVPERTLAMGLTMPSDYCWHCHQDVAESRPSHVGMKFDSCATAGCHNYHDNRALYEKFLDTHYGEPDMREVAMALARSSSEGSSRKPSDGDQLTLEQADHPSEQDVTSEILNDWAVTAHAAVGVNCSECHQDSQDGEAWSNTVPMSACQTCHADQVGSFQTGKHGMRLAAGLSPMTPELAKLPMHAGVAHLKLTCNTCHPGHRFDTKFAASEACLQCHADEHSLAYSETSHANLWAEELSGAGEPNTGVSCATCHLPRIEGDSGVWVNHDQNAGLRPNETMARQVCLNCHGLEFALSSLADPEAKEQCYGIASEKRIESVEMAHEWFVKRSAKRAKRQSYSTPSLK